MIEYGFSFTHLHKMTLASVCFWVTAGNVCSKALLKNIIIYTVQTNLILIVNRAFVALYVTIISPVGPIPIFLFVLVLEAEEYKISVF